MSRAATSLQRAIWIGMVGVCVAAAGCTIEGGAEELTPVPDTDVTTDTGTAMDTDAGEPDSGTPPDTTVDIGFDGGRDAVDETTGPDLADVESDVPPVEDTAPDVPPDVGPMPGTLPPACQSFEALPWNATRTWDLSTWASSADGAAGCFEPGDAEDRRQLFAVNLPDGYGVEITMRRVSGSFYMYLRAGADHCTATDPETCEFLGASGAASPDTPETSFFLANDTGADRVYLIRALAAEYQTVVTGEVEIETRVFEVADNATCEQAIPLPPDSPTVSGLGSTEELCGWNRPTVFYRVTLPPMTRAIVEDFAFTHGSPDCGCFGYEELRNATDAPRELIVEVRPEIEVSWTPHALEAHGRCETAAVVSPDQPGTGNFDDGGDHRTTCSTYGETERPLFWTLEIPAMTRAVVTATVNDGGGDYELRLATQSACNVTECDARVSMVSNEVALTLDNPTDAAVTELLNVATGFLPPPDQQVTVTAEFQPLP